MNTRCPPKRVQPPQSYSVGGQRSSGQLTGKPAGARPDYRGCWCMLSRGHPGRPNPPSPWTTLGQFSAVPWELPSTVGCGIAWTRTGDVQAIKRILHSSECFYWMRHSGALWCYFLFKKEGVSLVLAGMNVHPSEFDGIKQEFNVKGYPTFCYFEKGKFLHHYESYGATAKDIVEWMKNPQPPQPQPPEVVWSEQGSAVFHLTDDNCHQFLQDHPSVLLMFYAPCVLAAVDSTIHKAVGERYHITGFPTVKYFENGEEKYTLPHLRSKDKIIEWLHNPQAPPPPEQSWEEKPSSVSHLGAQDFRESLKKKKHALVMFYAPWCPHCKNAVPHFTAAADLFKEDRKIAYAAVDCTKGQNNELCKQESVEGYPTFNYYNYGKFIEKYSGDRGESGFIGFMKTLRGKDQEKVGKRKEEL
ncbi:UNVERIFIED_CONTAM: hypothetical protein FKN15_043166 [Acipenser sinensis]